MNEPNYTQVPNSFIEQMADLSGSEVKVFVAVCRKTIGWHKTSDAISYSQLRAVTGLENTPCSEALKSLEKRNLISIDRSPGKTNRIDLVLDTSPLSGDVPLQKVETTSPESGETKETLQKKEEPVSTPVVPPSASQPTELQSAVSFPSPLSVPKKKPVYDYDARVWKLTEEYVSFLADTYDGTDVMMELKKMKGWLDAHPKKIDFKRFITNWLSKSQDHSRTFAGVRR